MTTVENISLSSLYEAIIENAESNVLILDKEFSIVSLNPGFYWIFLEAYDIHLRKGQKLFELIRPVAPEIADRWQTRCLAALKGLSVSDEEEFESHSQIFSWKVYYKSIVVGSDNFVTIYARNISATRIFQNKILQHEANLRKILNSFNASIWLVNDKLELIDFNNDTFSYFFSTYHVTLHPSKNFIELLPETIPDLRKRWLDRLTDLIQKKELTVHVDHTNVNGKSIVNETRLVPVFSDKNFVGITIIVQDVTERMRDEQLQRSQMNDLRKLSSELDKFVTNASHDLRAPLLSIIGVINIMKRESPKDLMLFNGIEMTVKRLDNFVTNIINYSRDTKLPIIIEKIDFETVFSSVMDTLTYLENPESVKCIPVISQSAPFFSDRNRLITIIRNTLASALQFFDKTKTITIDIAVHVTAEFGEIEFTDNGIGPNLQQHFFEKFFNESDTSTGSSLSLFIIKSTVEKLGGSIEVKSSHEFLRSVVIKIPNRIVPNSDEYVQNTITQG